MPAEFPTTYTVPNRPEARRRPQSARGLLAVVTAVLAAAAVILAAPSLAAETLSEDAIKKLVAEGKFEEAISASRQKIASSPNDPQGHVLLANALFGKARAAPKAAAAAAQGRTAASLRAEDAEAIVKELEAGIKLAPQRKDIYLGIVDVWSAAGRDNDLIQQIERSGKQFPADAGMMNGLLDFGLERQMRSDPLAGRIIESVYAAYPKHPTAALSWATNLLRQGDLERSIQVLETTLAAAPGNSDLLESLGDAYCYKLDFQTAAKHYASASSDVSRRAVRLKWAVVLHHIDPQSAKVVVLPLRGDEKPSVSAKLQLGDNADLKIPGRIQRAASALLRALSNPSFGPLDAYGLAKNYWQNDLPTVALSETEVALSKDPSQVESWVLRGEIFTRTNLNRQALEALEKADSIYQAAKDRTFAYSRDEVLAALAAEQTSLGKDEEALGTYKRISDPARYYYRMAIAAEHVGRIDEARGWLEKVAASGTNESEAARSRLEQEPYRKKP